MKKKDEGKRNSRKPVWLPADTDRATYRMLTSEDDPHYALHTMAATVQEVSSEDNCELNW